MDHIIFEPETEKNDPYTGGQISFESGTFADLAQQPQNGPHDTIYGYYGSSIADEGY